MVKEPRPPPSIFIPEIIHINVHPSFREHNFSDLSTD
jgi:hypothetical protein